MLLWLPAGDDVWYLGGWRGQRLMTASIDMFGKSRRISSACRSVDYNPRTDTDLLEPSVETGMLTAFAAWLVMQRI